MSAIGTTLKQNKRFALWFRQARQRAQLTQEQLAERIGVAQPTIGYWENVGRERMTPEEVRTLALHLRVQPVEVVAALGYPTAAPSPARDDEKTAEADPVFIATEIARLSSRLAELLEGDESAARVTRVRS